MVGICPGLDYSQPLWSVLSVAQEDTVIAHVMISHGGIDHHVTVDVVIGPLNLRDARPAHVRDLAMVEAIYELLRDEVMAEAVRHDVAMGCFDIS